MRLERAGRPLDQQIERGLGRLELIAAVFQLDDLLEDSCPSGRCRSARFALLVRATMFERPESSLTSTRRVLPTLSGAMCS